MTLRHLNNQAAANGSEAYYLIKEHLKTHGWVHQASGNGTTFSTTPGNVNDQITSSALMQTLRAWAVYRAPGASTHQWLIQTEANTARIRLKFSPAAGFTQLGLDASGVANGAISATVCPSALDQVIVQGGISDQANNGSFGNTFPTNKFMLHGFCDDASPYGFAFWAVAVGLPVPQWTWYMDPLLMTWPGDPDPYAFHSTGVTANGVAIYQLAIAGGLSDETSGPYALIQRAGNVPNAVRAPGCHWAGVVDAAVFPRSTGAANNAPSSGGWYGGFAKQPMIYARRTGLTGPNGWKGISTLFEIRQGSHSTMTTLTYRAAKDRIALGDVTTFWDGSTPVL